VISDESEFNGFCPECFLLPDPRDSSGHQLQRKRYSHDISGFDDKQKVLVENLYSHNADHLKTNSQNLLAFVKQSGQQLYNYDPGFGVPQGQILEATFWKLLADFWVKLDAGHCPAQEERMLILQLQKVYEHQEFEDAIARQDNSGKRLHEIANTSTRVDESTLPADEDYCPICQEKYSELNRFGLEEWPCRFKACKHVMGWSCIGEWLFDHDSCPICRHTILPLCDYSHRGFQYDRDEEEDWFDLDWLKLLDWSFSQNRSEEQGSEDEGSDEEGDWVIPREEEEEEDDDGDYFTQALDRVDLYLERRQVPRGYILTN
jgi:hypothetical protein